jgi:hypothetical protein
VLFTMELERRWGPEGVHAFALHPGVIPTELSRHLTQEDFTTLSTKGRGGSKGTLTLVDVPTGAATQVWAATAAELDGRGGLYLEDCAIGGPTPGDGSAGYAPHAVDPQAAQQLWEWSEREVGLA